MKRFLILAILCLATGMSFAQSLSKAEAEALRESVISQWSKAVVAANAQELNSGILHVDSLQMPFRVRLMGKKPEGGYPLYISMHGGGNAPKALNDQQWQNQIMLYTPQCGYYIAPRAPWDDWNMWFKPGIDELFEKLISTLVAGGFVNPDKVYLMGYSAGGDGVWRLAPRLADHWAAASMMAGHPGDVSLVNVRNMPFSVWCGALDSAYDRNAKCSERISELDSLASANQGSYIHEGHIVEGKEHWMDRVDTIAVEWMAQHVRNPYPSTIVWQQEEVVRPRFYWLSVPKDEAQRGKKLTATIKGNVIDVNNTSYTTFTIWLNDSMLNLDKKVKVRVNGKTVFNALAPRTEDNLKASMALYSDPRYVFPASIVVKGAMKD